MIEVVISRNADHDLYVGETIDELQALGWEVLSVERIKKQRGPFGRDLSHIHYRNPHHKPQRGEP